MKSVLVTGATGTIGSALVPRLLVEPSTQLDLLIRSKGQADLERRLAEMLQYWNIPPGDPRALRIRVIEGDISLPNFGLSAAELSRLVSQTTHIIHSAASVKLNMSLEQARATAVLPTRTVLSLARQCQQAGQLRKVDLVSTVGVWGRTPGHMPERPLPEVKEFHNTYEAAKAEAEQVIWSEGVGLPITVHRPSMVVGERQSGRVIHFQVFYHLCEFLSGARTFGIMPKLGLTQLDTIPVDWVADAICWSSAQPKTAGRIFHLCSGPDHAIALTRLQAHVRELFRVRGRKAPRLITVDRQLLERLVPWIGALAGAKTRRALRGLSPVLAYLAESQGFSNAETAQTFGDAGLPVPGVDQYLDAVLGYYLDRPRTMHDT